MSQVQPITAHEPEEELLSAQDAWEDYLSLAQMLAEKRGHKVPLLVDPSIRTLVHDLVAAGICQDEAEVISRAVQTFFVAVYPQARDRLRILKKAQTQHSS